MARRSGYTLIELIMVIVLLSIVATVSVRFVGLSTQGALDTSARQLRALQSVVISEQITRELRGAFPLSVRVSTDGSCIEWLPVEAGTNYLNLSTSKEIGEIDIAAFADDPDEDPENDTLAVVIYGYGVSKGQLYTGIDPGSNTGPVALLANDPIDNMAAPATISLSPNHQFSNQSPARRLYVLGGPVSLCQGEPPNRQFLYRYSGYSPSATPPTPQSPPAVDPKVLAASLTGPVSFDFSPGTLERAAVVQFTFELEDADSGETTTVSQEVQIRNVP